MTWNDVRAYTALTCWAASGGVWVAMAWVAVCTALDGQGNLAFVQAASGFLAGMLLAYLGTRALDNWNPAP